MSNETVTYSLEAVLTRIEGKIDNLQLSDYLISVCENSLCKQPR
jgi:hypothetical protein